MTIADVNVLVYAFRQDADRHRDYKRWIEDRISSDEPYGVCDGVLAGFLRVVTHPKAFNQPSSIAEALEFVDAIRSQPNCSLIGPGERHWGILAHLCRATQAKGNLIPDAYFAALAIESGSEWITTDRDYSRFPGLRWRHPLA
jgi:uncharacterized protein